MNKKLILGSLSMMALLAVSCGTTNKNNVSDTVAEASSKAVDVEGQWGIVSVVVNDTLSVNLISFSRMAITMWQLVATPSEALILYREIRLRWVLERAL